MDVALHVTLGHVTAGAGAVPPSPPSGFCTHSTVPVNTAWLWGSFQLSAVLTVHLIWWFKGLQRVKAGIKDSLSTCGASGENNTAVGELKINQADELSAPQLETLQEPLLGWLMFGDGGCCRGLQKGITHLAVNG